MLRIDSAGLGQAVVRLGGGRLRDGDRVNPSVGLSDIAGIGEEVSDDLPLALVHAASDADAEAAIAAVQAAYVIADHEPEEPDLIHERIA